MTKCSTGISSATPKANDLATMITEATKAYGSGSFNIFIAPQGSVLRLWERARRRARLIHAARGALPFALK